MFDKTTSRNRWLNVMLMSVIGLSILGPMRTNGAYHQSEYYHVLPQSTISQSGNLQENPSPLNTPGSDAQQIVRERLSQIKSPQELMELNKVDPLLHQDVSQFRSVEVVATGYYAGVESTGKNPGHPEYGITFSGVKVRKGILSTIAADPKVFPLGTILYIPGYGYGIVADTGSAIKGKKIDLYYESIAEIYKEWGKKSVEVLVVQLGNGKVSEQIIEQWNDIMTAVEMQKDLPFLL